MKFTLYYEETLSRAVVVDANSLADAVKELENQINNETLVLDSKDFLSGQISLPLSENPLLELKSEGVPVDVQRRDYELVLEYW